MKGNMIGLVVVVIAVLMLGGCVAGQYNQLVTQREEVKNKWAQVDNQLQRRADLIGNLVETVKGMMIQEQEVFGAIANARAAMAGAKSPAAGIQAAQGMDSAIGRLLVVMENYPQLRSQENVSQLMDEVAGTENRIATERMRYNDVVKTFNVLVKRFPMGLFARMFGFEESPYYPVPESAKAAPKVDFKDMRRPVSGETPVPATK
ncbi:MAG: LemA family protein [Candidatus Eisenbacteria bacterium]